MRSPISVWNCSSIDNPQCLPSTLPVLVQFEPSSRGFDPPIPGSGTGRSASSGSRWPADALVPRVCSWLIANRERTARTKNQPSYNLADQVLDELGMSQV
jgi:hypothetical protein